MDWQYVATIVGTGISCIGIGALTVYFYARRNLNDIHKAEDANAVTSWRELMEYKSDDFRKKTVEYENMLVKMRNEMNAMHTAHMKCEREGMEREMEFKRQLVEREIEFKRVTSDLNEKVTSLQMQMAVVSSHQQANEARAVEVAMVTAASVVDSKVDSKEIERLKIHKENQQKQIESNAKELEKLKEEVHTSKAP